MITHKISYKFIIILSSLLIFIALVGTLGAIVYFMNRQKVKENETTDNGGAVIPQEQEEYTIKGHPQSSNTEIEPSIDKENNPQTPTFDSRSVSFYVGQVKKTVYTASFTPPQPQSPFLFINRLETGAKSDTILEEVKKEFFSRVKNIDQYFLFIDDNYLFTYNTKTQELINYDIAKDRPEINNAGKGDKLVFTLLEVIPLNDAYTMVKIESPYENKAYFLYLFDKQTQKFSYIDTMDCSIIYCVGPRLVKKISDEQFLFMYSGGDACWNAGKVYSFSTKTVEATQLVEYGHGCVDEKRDAYFGLINNQLITSGRVSVEGGGDFDDSHDVYTTLKSIDASSGKTTMLLNRDEMPKSVTGIQLVPEKQQIVLTHTGGQFIYDIGQMHLSSEMPHSQVSASDISDTSSDQASQKDDYSKLIEQYTSLFLFETKESYPTMLLDQPYVINGVLYGTDNEGDILSILTERQLASLLGTHVVFNTPPASFDASGSISKALAFSGTEVVFSVKLSEPHDPFMRGGHIGIYDIKEGTLFFFPSQDILFYDQVVVAVDQKQRMVLAGKPIHYDPTENHVFGIELTILDIDHRKVLQTFRVDFTEQKYTRDTPVNIFPAIAELYNLEPMPQKQAVNLGLYLYRIASIDSFTCTNKTCCLTIHIYNRFKQETKIGEAETYDPLGICMDRQNRVTKSL